jgi:hypothetical protein
MSLNITNAPPIPSASVPATMIMTIFTGIPAATDFDAGGGVLSGSAIDSSSNRILIAGC